MEGAGEDGSRIGGRFEARSVNEVERETEEGGFAFLVVAGEVAVGGIEDDGTVRSREAVVQGGLTHVGAADEAHRVEGEGSGRGVAGLRSEEAAAIDVWKGIIWRERKIMYMRECTYRNGWG